MLDNDSLTYKKNVVRNAAAWQGERTLLTQERSQKLDLLIHLLANLRQALVVCGPDGIGKTTLLQILQEHRGNQWQICLLQGSSALSFESITDNLSQFLNLGRSGMGFDLSSLRAHCEKQHVVLIIDDAGELVPGLIGELVDFADSLAGLRLVFSMTYDEFHIKSASDKAVDDCHFIELPPLNLKQCTEYLQNLSAQPGAMLSFNAVTDHLVEELYRETHGIPGKILAEIPKLNQYPSRPKSRLGLWLGIAGVVLAAGWAVTLLLPAPPPGETESQRPPETAEPAIARPTAAPQVAESEPLPPPVTPQVTESQTSPPKLELPPTAMLPTPDIAPIAEKNGSTLLQTPVPVPVPAPATQESPAPAKIAETPAATAPKPPAPEVTVVTPPTSETPAAKSEAPAPAIQAPEARESEAPVATATPKPEQKPSAPEGDHDWIMAQPASNYTIQLMVLSNKNSVIRFLKKYAQYRDNLKYFPVKQYDGERYVLIYGSFQSPSDAIKRKATMPNEFQNGLEKRFKAIQHQIRR